MEFDERRAKVNQFLRPFGISTSDLSFDQKEFSATLGSVDTRINFSNSRISQNSVLGAGDVYKFSYRRYDGVVNSEIATSILYKDLSHRISSAIFFSSGMGAITCLLFAVLSHKDFSVSIPQKDIYFETKKLFSSLSILEVASQRAQLLWLDTISEQSPSVELVNEFRGTVIVIDTTCWDQTDPRLKDLVKVAQTSSKTLIFIRSHTKLDMFGLEVASVGSAVIFDLNHQMQHEPSRIGSVLEQCLHEHAGTLGVRLDPQNLPLFWFDKNFNTICANRTKFIKSNNRELFKFLSRTLPKPFRLSIPEHGCFCLLALPDHHTREDLDATSELLKNFLSDSGLDVHAVGSFGFNFTAIDCYIDLVHEQDTIRISVGDWDPKFNLKLAILIQVFLQREK